MADKFLTPEDRRKLNRVISDLYTFTDGGARGRRVFLTEAAGLGRFIHGIDLSGASRTVAEDLTGRLEEFGILPERPTFHALGALIDAVLDLGDVSNEDKEFLARLVVRYSLVSDPAYIENLRTQYHVNDTAARAFSTKAEAPLPVRGAEVAGPQFDAAIPDEHILEGIIGSEDNFLDINLLYGALYCSQAVCMIEIPEGKPAGTGFLVNKDLLLTNYHVFKNIEYVRKAVARFGYMLDVYNQRTAGRVCKFNPEFYEYSPAEALDYALVRLEEQPLRDTLVDGKSGDLSIPELVSLGKHRGYLTVLDYFIGEHERVNIIQHPDGDPLKVVMTQNYVVTDMSAERVQYVADTMNGSSGSPVFNQKWQVVALHHSGSPYPPDSVKDTVKKAWKGNFRVNEGIPMRAILKDFQQKDLVRYLPGS